MPELTDSIERSDLCQTLVKRALPCLLARVIAKPAGESLRKGGTFCL